MEPEVEASRSSSDLEKKTVDPIITLDELPTPSTPPPEEAVRVLPKKKKKLSFYMSNVFLGILSFLIALDATTLPVALPVRLSLSLPVFHPYAVWHLIKLN
jgi:hypothetical protein